LHQKYPKETEVGSSLPCQTSVIERMYLTHLVSTASLNFFNNTIIYVFFVLYREILKH